jgi:high-affinity iron transporter
MIRSQKSLFIPIFAIVTLPFLTSALTFARATDDAEALVVIVNLERIRTQLSLTEKSVAAGDMEMAFAHASIPHSATFPAVKDRLKELDEQSASQLEVLLTDLPLRVKADDLRVDEIKQDIGKIEALLDGIAAKLEHFNSDTPIVSQTAVFLLRDAVRSYQLSSGGSSQVDYENAIGLVDAAKVKYQTIADLLEEARKEEVDAFFAELKSSIAQNVGSDHVALLAGAIERDLVQELSLSTRSGGAGEHAQYFSAIRMMLTNVTIAVKAGNYDHAEQQAILAYLDNYEYLEAPIEKKDPELMTAIEKEMNEELRGMIRAEKSSAEIDTLVNDILAKLDRAQELLNNDPSTQNPSSSASGIADIEELKAGFGAYSGQRREIGEADDQAKAAVRGNIDQIRVKLDETLRLYKEGNSQAALLESRSAYLDSYESIEVPLRPIDPDFTLEMEIKFAELRNLIQSGAAYEKVESKVVEIRRGLDQSERLVSGTGVIAPAIAFSTSFSIIFREGLESALIVGAILTYLEASRTDRFKKHVYYGILIALAATAVTWFVARFIIEISGASKALIEAIAGMSAVAVLFWVSFWILNKVETKKWIEFVKAKVWKATTTGSVMVFVMLSFFTVYREGFETVLFYQALISFAGSMEWYVVGGLLVGLAVIVGVTFTVRKLGKRLPLRLLFGLTMGIGAYMSIAFMGNAVREFQEVGYVSTTHLIGIVPRLDINLATMTGIHPTIETIAAQFILLAVYLTGSIYLLVIQPKRIKAIEAARKSRADFMKKEPEKKSLDLE